MKPFRFSLVFLAAALFGLPQSFAANPGWTPLSAKEISDFSAALSSVNATRIFVHYSPEEEAFAKSLVEVAKNMSIKRVGVAEPISEKAIVIRGVQGDPAAQKLADLIKIRFPGDAVKLVTHKPLTAGTPNVLGGIDVYIGAKPL